MGTPDEHVAPRSAAWFRVFAGRVRLPDGRKIDSWLRSDGPLYAVVFAIATDGSVLFVEVTKYGPDRMIWQLPAVVPC
jgi:hypothetical protein